MANILMQPPATGNKTTRINGRTYTGVLGTPQTVPDFDADALQANGWMRVAVTGTTAQRPTSAGVGVPLAVGYSYNDTTLAAMIRWDGAKWRDAITGAAV